MREQTRWIAGAVLVAVAMASGAVAQQLWPAAVVFFTDGEDLQFKFDNGDLGGGGATESTVGVTHPTELTDDWSVGGNDAAAGLHFNGTDLALNAPGAAISATPHATNGGRVVLSEGSDFGTDALALGVKAGTDLAADVACEYGASGWEGDCPGGSDPAAYTMIMLGDSGNAGQPIGEDVTPFNTAALVDESGGLVTVNAAGFTLAGGHRYEVVHTSAISWDEATDSGLFDGADGLQAWFTGTLSGIGDNDPLVWNNSVSTVPTNVSLIANTAFGFGVSGTVECDAKVTTILETAAEGCVEVAWWFNPNGGSADWAELGNSGLAYLDVTGPGSLAFTQASQITATAVVEASSADQMELRFTTSAQCAAAGLASADVLGAARKNTSATCRYTAKTAAGDRGCVSAYVWNDTDNETPVGQRPNTNGAGLRQGNRPPDALVAVGRAYLTPATDTTYSIYATKCTSPASGWPSSVAVHQQSSHAIIRVLP